MANPFINESRIFTVHGADDMPATGAQAALKAQFRLAGSLVGSATDGFAASLFATPTTSGFVDAVAMFAGHNAPASADYHVPTGFADGSGPRSPSQGGLGGASAPGLTQKLVEYQSGGTWHFSGNQDIDAVLFGSEWSITNLTYSFPTDNTHYNTPYYKPDFIAHQEVLNPAQQAAAVYAFGLISSYTNLTFTQVTESDTVHGNIRISQTSSTQEASAEGNFPGSDASDGDIWIGDSASNPQPFYLTPQIGNWGQATFMHEIGHTMGLKHGHDNYTSIDLTVGGYLDGPGPFYGTAALPANHDGQAWSLMTYRSDPGNAIVFEGDEFNMPQTYMQDDIAALQYLYGANFTTNATDSVYTFSATTGEMFINGVSQGDPDGNKVFRTVWDGNGNDTYNFSNFSGDESVDLRAGGWSTFNAAQLANNRAYTGGVNYAPGNIANALMYAGDARSLIENAIGGSGNDRMVGNQLDNHLTGNGGNDWLDGGLGNDTLIGGAGDDTYFIDNPSDVIVENAGQGSDTVAVGYSYVLTQANVENITLTGTAGIDATGNDLDNILTGNSSVNVLTGGLGNDTYMLPDSTDTIVEAANGGTDRVVANISYTVGDNVENLTLTGRVNLAGTGNGLDNVIYGNVGDNVLSGGNGNDTLVGDVASSDSAVDISDTGATLHDVIANAMVIARASYFLNANPDITDATTAPHATIHATGNNDYRMYAVTVDAAGVVGTFDIDHNLGGLDTYVRLYDASGTLLGSSDDHAVDPGSTGTTDSFLTYTFTSSGTYYVEVAKYNHVVIPTTGGYDLNISLAGNSYATYGNDTLDGGAGNDSLDGGLGTDTMTGGTGDDSYFVDDLGDVAVENAGEGTDTVFSSISYSLVGEVENLTLTGVTNIQGLGNSLNNVMTGNAVDNMLYSYDGNDTLDGRQGADTMTGATGNDTYFVDNTGDVVVENAGEGSDTVIASISYVLGANVENLTLTGTLNRSGYGNSLGNVIVGNSGNNALKGYDGNDSLDGGLGADTMTGGNGDDTYFVDNSGDVVVELANQGNDTVATTLGSYTLGANVENLFLQGAGDSTGIGNSLDNVMIGNDGNNVMDGGAGADLLYGAGGNDTYIVDSVLDQVSESGGWGIDMVQSSVTFTLGDGLDNLILTGAAAINGTGNNLDNIIIGNGAKNILTGGDGNDYLDGGANADTMIGGIGNDTYILDNSGDVIVENASEGIDTVYAASSYTLLANFENLTLTGVAGSSGYGNAADNVIIGNSGNNSLRGYDGNDTLDGGLGADTMNGGLGDDTFIVDNAGDVVIESAGQGTDTVKSSVTFVLGATLENLTLTGTDDINATGNSLNNVLTGNSGDNFIDGGTGADTMTGGLGDDSYFVDNAGDVVTENANEGSDFVFSSISYTLGANVENLLLLGGLNRSGYGNGLDNVIFGNGGNNALKGYAGNDTLNGGVGADTMSGGLDNDTYYVDNAGDVVVELAGQGVDSVISSLTYSLGSDVENLYLSGADAINGTGNDLANQVSGNDGDNVLMGLGGNDVITGGLGNDTLIGGLGDDTYVVDDAGDVVTENANEGVDTVQASISYTLGLNVENLLLTTGNNVNATGNALDNLLTGGGGDNVLDGKAGADTMTGGNGNDTYYVDVTGDSVVEYGGEGFDTVVSSISYVLTHDVEALTLTGTLGRSGYGNALDNVITGNSGNNALKGYDGNDTLDGGLGNDTLTGGMGDDTYVLDNAGDVVVELAGQGIDTVRAGFSYVLDVNLENLTLTGTAAVNGTGNGSDNILIGNSGANTLIGGVGSDRLDGGVGADTLVGGVGNDTYVVDSASDIVTENVGEGSDTVEASVSYVLGANVENLHLTGTLGRSGYGNELNNQLGGNSGNNSLKGYGGNDLLDGGLGDDTLSGGLGADVFIFNASSGHDTVTDFVASQSDMFNVHTYSNGTAFGGGVTITADGLGNTIIDLGGGNNVTVTGASVVDVSAHMIW